MTPKSAQETNLPKEGHLWLDENNPISDVSIRRLSVPGLFAAVFAVVVGGGGGGGSLPVAPAFTKWAPGPRARCWFLGLAFRHVARFLDNFTSSPKK